MSWDVRKSSDDFLMSNGSITKNTYICDDAFVILALLTTFYLFNHKIFNKWLNNLIETFDWERKL
mgnify:CR=1 FL=1